MWDESRVKITFASWWALQKGGTNLIKVHNQLSTYSVPFGIKVFISQKMFITSKTLFGAKFSFILMKEELQQTMTLFESNYNSQCFEGFFSEWIENTSVQISRIQNQEIILYSWVVESGQIFLAYQTYGNCLSLSCKKKICTIFWRENCLFANS